MSDPLSVAGTAVGIISLGLQVCKEIVSYCEAWRGYDEDIQRIATGASELRLPLQQLRYLIEDPSLDDPEILKDLAGKAFRLEETVVRLRNTIDRLKPILSDSVPDKIRAQVKKASYPFQKNALRDVASDLERIQSVLQTTLSIYSARKITEIGTVSETILGKVNEMHLILSTYSPKTLPPPGLLQSCCDCQREFQQSMMQNRSKYREKPVAHVYRYYSRLLGLAFTASFWRPTGAGGFSIPPSLDLKMMPVLDRHDHWTWDTLDGIRCRSGKDSDSFLMWFRQEFTKKGLTRAYDLHFGGDRKSMVDFFSFGSESNHGHLSRFLLDLGSIPNSTDWGGALGYTLSQPNFGEAEYLLVSDLVERSGPIQFFRANPIFKKNLQFILSEDAAMVALPEIATIILQESEDELRHALEAPKAAVCDRVFKMHSLLELALGWPQGVQMLLDWGLFPDDLGPHDGALDFNLKSHLTEIKDNLPSLGGYCESVQILIRAGWQWYTPGLTNLLFCRSRKLRALFANDLLVQRQTLWRQAKQFLLTEDLPVLEEGSVLDINVSCVYEALVAQGRIDPQLRNGSRPMKTSVYHDAVRFSVEEMEELYQAGFRDIDSSDHQGRTPLMCLLWVDGMGSGKLCEKFAWFTSKGADPFHRMPRSSATVAHEFSRRLTHGWISSSCDIPQDCDQILRTCGCSLLSSIKDECVCACSPGGCSILTVALKYGLDYLYTRHFTQRPYLRLRRLLQTLVDLYKSTSDFDKTIIRFFTFDGLGVKHACCVNSYYPWFGHLQTKDWEEVEDILEEEQPRLEFLEELVAEFEAKHAELGLPILEFLEKHWHTRMLAFLSQRDNYDEENHKGCKRLGIYLEAEDDDLPDRVSFLIGPRLVELKEGQIAE